MSEKEITQDVNYKKWLSELKNKIRYAQVKAALSVNRDLLQFYWDLGAGIVLKQAQTQWGDGFITRLSKDLVAEFSEIKGFSVRNIKYIKQWYLFYNQPVIIVQEPVAQLNNITIAPLTSQENPLPAYDKSPLTQFGQQVVAQITSIPWGHNIAIISKCRDIKEAHYYVQQTLQNNWSRSVLVHQIESGLYQREGKAVSNFALTLPKPQSDLARQTLKDPYVFDFALVPTLLRGNGYLTYDSFMHSATFCNAAANIHSHAGAWELVQDDLVAEYALSDIHKPIGISEYELTRSLPDNLKSSLPSIEKIEAELSGKEGAGDE